ncbi:MAG: response regulator, partial [Pacificimonas sp.]
MSQPKRVLVAEDNMLVMLSLEGLIEDMGWELVGPAATVDAAMQLVAAGGFDVALLDVNLSEENSFPVARELKARNQPCVFVTGYDLGTDVPSDLRDVPVIV